MAKTVAMGCRGLLTAPAPLTVPHASAAMRKAENVMLGRTGFLEPRFGFKRDAAEITATSPGAAYRVRTLIPVRKQSLSGRELLIVSSDGADWVWKWGNDTLVDMLRESSGEPEPFDVNLADHRYALARGNLYVTTTNGIRKLTSESDADADKPMHAVGQPSWVIVSNAPTWLPTGRAVAYRVLIRRTDANGYVIRTAPCAWTRVQNGEGADRSVSLNVPLASYELVPPEQYGYVVAGDVVEVYRSLHVASAGDPADDTFYAMEVTLVAGDIDIGRVTIIDTIAEADLGAACYINAGQDGAEKSNEAAPCALDVANFRECMWYGNTVGPHTVDSALKHTSVTSATQLGFHTVIGTVTFPGSTVTAIASTANLQPGMAVTDGVIQPTAPGTTNVGVNAHILTVDSGTQITLTVPNILGGAGVTLNCFDKVTVGSTSVYAGNATFAPNETYGTFLVGASAPSTLRDTAVSLAFMLSFKSAVVMCSAIELPLTRSIGLLLREKKPSAAGTAFTLTSSKPDSFSPALGAGGVTSTRDARRNGLMWSKTRLPEAVPYVNFLTIGAEQMRILRLVPLRDSLLVFKDDGIFRVSGSAPDGWRVDAIEADTRLLVPDAVATMDNSAFAFTDRGMVEVTEHGVRDIGGPFVGPGLKWVQERLKTGFNSYSQRAGVFAVAHPRRGFVAFSLPMQTVAHGEGFGATNTQTWAVYWPGSEAWTTWIMRVDTDGNEGVRCAAWDDGQSAMYISEGTAAWGVRKERTEENAADSCLDDTHAITISGTSGSVTISVSAFDGWVPVAGDIIAQGAFRARVNSYVGADVNVDSNEVFVASASTAYEGAVVDLEWMPVTRGFDDSGQFVEATIQFHGMALGVPNSSVSGPRIRIGGSNDRSTAPTTFANIVNISLDTDDFYPQRPVRAWLQRELQRGNMLIMRMQIQGVAAYYGLQGVAVVYEEGGSRVWR